MVLGELLRTLLHFTIGSLDENRMLVTEKVFGFLIAAIAVGR
jgi:hypothetical protein